MELEGKIIKVLDERSGTSARTGTPWKMQSFVLEVPGQYPRRMVFEVFGEEKLTQMNIQEGQDLRVSFDIDAHEYQGRWYNSIRAWKVEPATGEAAPAPVAAAPGVAAPAAAAPTAEAPFGAEESTDDLPF